MGILGTIIAIIVGIAVFMFLVLIHELGHFVTAKKSGVNVLEFGMGIPPKVKSLGKDKGGTEYTLNAIPLGGFVRLKGEDPSNKEEFDAKDSFLNATLPRKVLILLGGVFVNFVFAWLVFGILFVVGIRPLMIAPENATIQRSNSYLMPTMTFLIEKGYVDPDEFAVDPLISAVTPDSLASQLGLKEGDVIQTVNQYSVDTLTIKKALQEAIGQKDVKLTVLRNGLIESFNFDCPDSECILGVGFEGPEKVVELPKISFGFFESFGVAAKEMYSQSSYMLQTLGELGKNLVSFKGKEVKESLDKFSGPVGAVGIGQVLFLRSGVKGYLAFMAMISLALAVFNLLPIPALDGGRLVGVLIQSIFRLKKEKYFVIEGYLNAICFLLLLGLGIYIIFKDLNTVWGVSLF